MRGGIWVLAGFAAFWGCAAILMSGEPAILVAIPLAISALVLAWGLRQSGTDAPRAPHVGRLIGIWSAIEGVALFIAGNLLINLGRIDLLLPVMAIIVGLHFLPLARGIPVRLYYGTAAGLVLTGLAGTALPAAERPLVVGIAAALILWASAVLLVRSRPGAASA